jgi:hypothetical protein
MLGYVPPPQQFPSSRSPDDGSNRKLWQHGELRFPVIETLPPSADPFDPKLAA